MVSQIFHLEPQFGSFRNMHKEKMNRQGLSLCDDDNYSQTVFNISSKLLYWTTLRNTIIVVW